MADAEVGLDLRRRAVRSQVQEQEAVKAMEKLRENSI